MNEDTFAKIVQSAIKDQEADERRHQRRMQMIAHLAVAERRLDNVLLFGLATVIVISVVFAAFAIIMLVGHIGG